MRDSESEKVREELQQYLSRRPCTTCQGARLRPEALAIKVGGQAISAVTALSVSTVMPGCSVAAAIMGLMRLTRLWPWGKVL